MAVEVRQAQLDDTQAICALFQARIGVWQRMDEQGRVQNMDYSALTVYERWLHGGAWMSIETGAVFLNHLLLGAGIPLIALEDARVVGYAEAYHSVEPEPFGSSLHLEHLIVADADGAGDELLVALEARAKTLKCRRITVNRVSPDVTLSPRYTLDTLTCLRRYTLSARTGQVFYRSVEHLDPDPAQISGWMMPVGRFTSARHQWETLMPRIWDTIPQIAAQRTHRQRLSVTGQDSLMVVQQQLYDPRSATVYLWSLKPITAQTVTALRDWTHREGYRTLIMAVHDDATPTLGPDAEADGFMQETCALIAQV
jgi:hypothetical protein